MEIGDVLAGKYRVERVLGRGGMGIVVQAMHLQLMQPVAVKFLLPEVLHNEQVVQRFLREAQAAVRLKSEHVARVIDVGQFDTGAPYMVLEYLDGLDLAHFPRAQLTVGLIVDFMLQACEALAEAHAIGIVHRDIKPANFFVTRGPDGSYLVKILDFGISKAPTGQQDRNLTATMMVMGTPAYMSPEQMRASKSVDNRSDIWSLGIVLYELLQGVPPFEADTFSSMIIKVATEQLPPMTVRLPAGLDTAVYRCLDKDPARRFQNVAELAAAIAPYAGSSVQAAVTVDRTSRVYGTYPPKSSPPTTLTSSAGAMTQPPSGKKRWPLFAGIGTVVVAGIAIAAVAAGGGGNGSGSSSSNAPSSEPAAPPSRSATTPPSTPGSPTSGSPTPGSTSGTTSGTTAGTTSATTPGSTSGSTAGSTSGTTSGSTTAGSTTGTTAGATSGSMSGSTAGSTSGTTAAATSGSTAGSTRGTTAGATSGSTTGSTAGSTSGTTAAATSGSTAGSTTTGSTTTGSTTAGAKGGTTSASTTAGSTTTGSTTAGTKGGTAGSKVTVHHTPTTPAKPPTTPTKPPTSPTQPGAKPGPGSASDDILGTRN